MRVAICAAPGADVDVCRRSVWIIFIMLSCISNRPSLAPCLEQERRASNPDGLDTFGCDIGWCIVLGQQSQCLYEVPLCRRRGRSPLSSATLSVRFAHRSCTEVVVSADV